MTSEVDSRIDPADASELLALAVAMAHEAGELLLDGRAAMSDSTDTKSSPTDVVTEMDRASERLILSRLRAARPDDAVLAEEGGAEAGSSGVRWLIDPIDGTVNYVYQLPQWAVSIAAEVDGTVVAGVVYHPNLRRTYTATQGGGAWRDGVRLHGSQVTQLPQTLVATGFGYTVERRRRQAEVVAAVLPQVRDIRRLGSAALDLCAAAAGEVDAYYERGLRPWDLAAGVLVAAEAGLRVEGLRGEPASGELVLAAPPAVFGPLHDLLAELRADED